MFRKTTVVVLMSLLASASVLADDDLWSDTNLDHLEQKNEQQTVVGVVQKAFPAAVETLENAGTDAVSVLKRLQAFEGFRQELEKHADDKMKLLDDVDMLIKKEYEKDKCSICAR